MEGYDTRQDAFLGRFEMEEFVSRAMVWYSAYERREIGKEVLLKRLRPLFIEHFERLVDDSNRAPQTSYPE